MNVARPAVPVVPHGLLVGIPPVAHPGMIPGAAQMVIPSAPEFTGTPNNTIYINNLNHKIKRDELKKSLYAIFAQFGLILDIITSRRFKLRGQAFVVFDDVNYASTALRAMQGFPLYDRPMRIRFAKVDSDMVAKRKGTFVPRPKAASQAAARAAAEAAAVAVSLGPTGGQGGASARAIRRRQQRAAAAALAAASADGVAIPPPSSIEGIVRSAPAPPPPINPATIPDQQPNKILFLTNLPEDADDAMLSMLFNQFPGYREVRMVPGRHDIAFVEFESEVEAGAAKHGLNGFNIRPEKPIRITFAKK